MGLLRGLFGVKKWTKRKLLNKHAFIQQAFGLEQANYPESSSENLAID
jgi:hypothetical protein